MTWAMEHRIALENKIDAYKFRMGKLALVGESLKDQNDILELSQRLDELIFLHQKLTRRINLLSSNPYPISHYMNRQIELRYLNNTQDEENVSKSSHTILIGYNNEIVGLLTPEGQKVDEKNFIIIDNKASLTEGYSKLFTTKCNYLIVTEAKGKPIGVLTRKEAQRLCSRKKVTEKELRKISRFSKYLGEVPLSIFILDNNLYIDYVNQRAMESFVSILPEDYLFRKAELVFSNMLSESHDTFVDSPLWRQLRNGTDKNGLEVNVLKDLNLIANIKVVKNNGRISYTILSFLHKGTSLPGNNNLLQSTHELSQALSVFIPEGIEHKLRSIPEYKDIYNCDLGQITIISKIHDGGYWHVVNCLKLLSQFISLGFFMYSSARKEVLIKALIVHDLGKKQPDLHVGSTVDPKVVFEPGKLHAFRSAEYCQELGYERDICLLVKYHHHKKSEIPSEFPKYLFKELEILQLIDGLSSALTRRAATISFELSEGGLTVHERNREREEFNVSHYIGF